MAKKKLAIILSTAALIGSLFSTSAFAAENLKSSHDNDRGTLVGLGDSITFGYNLGPTNNQPSKLAFPYLIGLAAHENVIDLGVPGWTTTNLLSALNTNATFQASLKQADKVTIDIGSNDLLQLLVSTNGNVTPQAVAPILVNLHAIMARVKCLAPHADIVVYDIYNPFQVSDVQNHVLADTLLPQINLEIAGVVASFHDRHIVLADAYSAFGQNQVTYVRQGDIHPTVAGQEKLAEIGFADFVLEKWPNRYLNNAER